MTSVFQIVNIFFLEEVGNILIGAFDWQTTHLLQIGEPSPNPVRI